MTRRMVLGLALVLALTQVGGLGCAKKKLDSMPAGATRAGELSEQELARRRAEEMAARERELSERNRAGMGREAGDGKIFSDSALAREMNADLIHFDYDSYELNAEARQILQHKAELMKANSSAQLVIEGHSDERGTNEYNLALGERRAKAAYDFLVTLGVPAERMRTVSYGEERPADPGQSESAYYMNRRDEFKILE